MIWIFMRTIHLYTFVLCCKCINFFFVHINCFHLVLLNVFIRVNLLSIIICFQIDWLYFVVPWSYSFDFIQSEICSFVLPKFVRMSSSILDIFDRLCFTLNLFVRFRFSLTVFIRVCFASGLLVRIRCILNLFVQVRLTLNPFVRVRFILIVDFIIVINMIVLFIVIFIWFYHFLKWLVLLNLLFKLVILMILSKHK